MERVPLRERKLVRYAERAVALYEEYRTEHARLLRHANHRGLRDDGAHAQVDFAVKYLVHGIGGVIVVDDECGRQHLRRRREAGFGFGFGFGLWPRGGSSLLCDGWTSDDPLVVEHEKRATSFVETAHENLQIILGAERGERLRYVSVQHDVHLALPHLCEAK